ncbi:DUF2461 domain-containing protein [Aquimarina sp. 2201CG14-23]|uniref:DUF2461 domain-containing protein n=1 Tax=Aquimarina mycalae TaxID=3040073 RepID=UPI002477D41A|nr:DUF2461 domain-containing protein [Aquimarina sp. 2201CG14-23]MDH7447386.1 DUF2461 domain-containing protein [Aquimarina sp. 2201CG14-23]
MKYFTEDFNAFFKDLTLNNHKDWFQEHKKRYEASVKKPFSTFVRAMIEEIQKLDAEVLIEPKDCILRINRDIRFSKDKSPYNLYYTAIISKVGKKDKSIPGIFIRFSPEMVGVMGGCFNLSKEQLHRIRTKINGDPTKFRNLIQQKDFVQKFGEIRGDVMKRIPKEWQEACEKEPLIANKQFYFLGEEALDLITSTNLIKELMEYWKAMHPVNEFLTKAVQ